MYDRIICIPACEERDYLPTALESLRKLPYKKLLLISNNCRSNASAQVKENNQDLHQWILQFPHSQTKNRFEIAYPDIDILYFDHFSPEFCFTERQGVGQARRLLAIEALAQIKAERIASKWIWCTDADAQFSQNYLEEPPKNCGIQLSGYIHRPAPKELLLYELSLRYYSLGLEYANSPFAFPTIGSTIAIHAATYQKSHGFSDRQAAEDFYLLNKAVKVSPLYYSDSAEITITGRPSSRVPFGTGQAMQAIRENDFEKLTYNPEIFYLLKKWHHILRTVSDQDLLSSLEELVPDYPALRKFSKILKQKSTPNTMVRRRFAFFDCFQTMRWIHHLKNNHYPDIPILEALEQSSFIKNTTTDLLQMQSNLYQQERQLRGRFYSLKSEHLS